MIDKLTQDLAAVLAPIADGATVLIGGFGSAGVPSQLIDGLLRQGARELTVVNNAGSGKTGLAALLKAERVGKIICSFPRQADSWVFERLYRSGQVELELVPQGTLAERLRAAGAGICAFFSTRGYGTELVKGKGRRVIGGRPHVLEMPIFGDVALNRAERGDRWGNLVYRKAARNFGPVMATAARMAIATVHEVVPLAALDPEAIVTPGIYVDHVVQVSRGTSEAEGFHRALAPGVRVARGDGMTSPQKRCKDDLARCVSREISDGADVNLGIGEPTGCVKRIYTEVAAIGCGPGGQPLTRAVPRLSLLKLRMVGLRVAPPHVWA